MTVATNLALEEAAMRLNITGQELLGIVTGYGCRGWRTPLRAKLAVMLKDEYGWSFPQIARNLGLRSHTSALGLYRMGKPIQRNTQDPERAMRNEPARRPSEPYSTNRSSAERAIIEDPHGE